MTKNSKSDNFFNEFYKFVKEDLIENQKTIHGLKYINKENRKEPHLKRIRFSVAEWEDFPFQLTCKKWNTRDSIRQILVFEFRIQIQGQNEILSVDNKPNFLDLVLTIGPCDPKSENSKENRRRVRNTFITQNNLVGLRDHTTIDKGRKWTQVFYKDFLKKAEETGTLDEVKEKIKSKWDDFLINNLPCIKEVVRKQLYS